MNMNMNVYTESLNKMLSQAETFSTPLLKANQLAVENVEKLVDFQLKSFQKYTDMSIANLKAAAQISNPSELQAYVGKQADTINSVRHEVMEDFKALTDLGTEMREDLVKLTEKGAEDFQQAAAKTAKTAKKASK